MKSWIQSATDRWCETGNLQHYLSTVQILILYEILRHFKQSSIEVLLLTVVPNFTPSIEQVIT